MEIGVVTASNILEKEEMKTTDRTMKVWVQNGPRSAKRTRPPTRGGWLTMAVAVLAVLATGAADLRAADAVPDVSLGVPGSTRLGSDFSFTAAFDNASADQTGYGPYVDIAIDASGPDGDPDDPGADPLDGIDIAASGAVTHLGAPVTYHLLTFDDDANGGQGIAHPYAVDSGGNPITVKTTDFPGGTFENGDILLVALLPFGSFTPEQPAAVLNIDATLSDLADLDKTHDFSARGGFQYGNDPIENPSTDPSITQPAPDDADLQPTLWDLSKVYIGPEDETATGPNFTREYVLKVDIADGQTIDDVIVTDELPIEMQFVEIVDATKNSGAYTDPTPTLPSTSIPGGTLEYSFGTITGGPGVDATVTFKWFIPRLDANSDVIIAANTGDDVLSENQAWAEGHWDPIDTRDPELDVYAQATAGGPDADPEHTLEDQSNAIQKGGAIIVDNGGAGFTPDDVVEYTLEIQISDYFAFDDLIVDDLLGDGQVFDDSFTPTLSISEHGSSSSGDFDIANYTETTNRTADGDPAPNDGTTALQFRISDELVARGLNANLTGGGIDSQTTGLAGGPYNNPPLPHAGTTATITYRAIVSDEYSDDYPSGDAPLNPGDGVGNSVVLDGRLLDPADNLNPYPGDPREDDDSGAGFSIPLPELAKSFHAINGDTDSDNWVVDPSGNPNVQPGDTVTFRLTYELPSRDLEDFSLTDYVPLPVFHVDDPDEDGSAGPAWTFDAVYPGDATPPAAGHAKFGPDESFHPIRGAYPAVSINTANGNNTLIFDYGTADDPTNTPGTVDILFTVTVADDPFADGLFLTNQVRASEQDTDATATKQDKIVNFVLNQPEVTIHKGVVGYRDTGLTLGGITFTAPDTASSFAPTPAYSPSQASAIGASDLLTNEVDAGDDVRFAIMVRNGGRSDSFDISLTDAVPAGFDIPANLTAMDLAVRRGDGTLLTQGADYTASIDGSGNLSLELTDNYTAGNLGGDDDSGALSRGYNAGVDGDVTNGANAVIVTYDLTVASSAEALGETTNTVALTNYAGVEGGDDFTAEDPTDDATVNFRPAAIDKVFDTTEIDDAGTTGHNSNGEAVIGEISSYTLTVTVPEGVTADAVLTDTLDSGLAFIQVTGVTASADLTIENPIGTGANPANATVSNAGRTVEYNFGDITNSNTDNGTAETITITYEAVVLNVAGNQEGTQLNNVAAFDYKNNGAPITDASATITVIEPVVTVDKQVSENVGGPWVDNNGELDAGDTFYYRIRITNPAADSTVAYNLLLTDDLPAALGTSVIHSVTADNYDASDFEILGGTVQVKASQNPDGLTLSPGETIDIFLENIVGSSVEPTQPIDNEDATVTWTSLDDGNTTPENPPERSTHNTSSVERSGDDGEGGAVDDYEDVDDTPASITVRNPDPTKTLVATSESHTAGNRVAVGEIARYRIAWQIPEGQTTDLNFLDRIPNGLVFLDDGTAKLAFVSNDPSGGLSSADPALSGPGLDISGDSGAVTPTFVIPAGAISPAGFDSGTDVTFDLGTVTNADRDLDGEYIVIEFNALVHNDTTHQNDAGDNRRNNFRVRTGGTVLGTSPNETVRISEPQLNISKGVSAGPYDAGDTVTYTLTVTNAGGANATTAFDIVIADTLPAELVAPALDSTATTGTVVGLAASFAGNDLTATATSMDAGATIEIVYSATIESDLPAGTDIVNDADVVYTSLPGAGTTGNPTGSDTPGASGDEDGERNGSGTGANDYNDADTAPIEGDKPSVDKSFQDGSITDDDTNVATSFGADVVIGETVVFDLLVTVPEGETDALRVNDALPAGLRLDSYDVLTDAADTTLLGGDFNGTVTDTPAVSPALPADGAASVEFDFGTTTVVDDNDGTNNAFVLRLTATVTNIAGNQSGVDRENTASVTFDDPDTGEETLPDANAGNDPEVTVVEPFLEIEKTADPSTADAGDTVVYTFEITNTSDQMAYDVDLLDTLPDKLNGPAILTGANFAAAGFYDAAVQAATTADIANLATAPATIDGYALSEDDLVLVKDQADPVDNGIYIVDSVAGTADLVRWTDFDEAAEVTQGYLARVDNGATHAGTVFRQTETLGSVGTDPIVWAEYGAYAIPAADDFEIFVDAGSNVLHRKPAANVDMPAGSSITLKVSGTLDASVQADETITNSVDITWTSTDGANPDERGGSGGVNDYNAGDDADVDIDVAALDKALIETELVEAGNAADDAVIGEKVTYTVTITVPEGVTADAVLTDTLDAGLAFVEITDVTLSAGVSSANAIGTGANPANVTVTDSGRALEFDFGDITNTNTDDGVADTIAITYDAVALDIPANASGTTLDNSVAFDYTNNGAPLTDSADEITVVEPNMTIAKTVGTDAVNFAASVADLDAGDTIYYRLRVVSNGETNAYNVTLQDTLPAGLTGASVHSVSGGGFGVGDFEVESGVVQVDDAAHPDGITVPTGTSVDIVFEATLADTVEAGQLIRNDAASVDWTSMDDGTTADEVPTQRSTHNPDSTERHSNADNPAPAPADVNVSGPALAKSLVETSEGSTPGSDVTIGETVTYALKVTLPEGSIPDLTVVDEVPAGMQYVSSSLHSTAAGSGGLLSADFAGSFTDAGEPDITGGAADGADVTFTFDAGPPAITVTGDNDADNNSFLILVTLRVLDVPGNVGVNPPGQTTLANSATLDISTDGEPPVGAGPVDVTVVEPRMVITKSMSPDPAAPGQTITVTLTVENTGTSDAFDVIVEDPLTPAHFDSATVDQGASGTDYPADFTAELDGDTVRYSGGTLADGATVTMTYTVDLTDTVAHGDSVDNTATVTQATTLPGADPDERDEPDVDDDDTLTVAAHLINGTVYHDINVNGDYDVGTDVELENVTVTLTGTDIHGAPVNRTLQTDANGFYEFDDLLPGDYTVTETQPADYLDHHETVGTNFGGTVDNTADSNVTTDITIPTGLATATSGAGYDFGEIKLNSLAGTVFADINNDGILNGADFGLESVDVTLTGTDGRGNPVSTTIQTDANGDYLFDNLRPGTYTLTETQPVLYGDGIDTLGSEGGDDSVNDVFSAIDLTGKQDTDGVDYDFAEIPGTISGQVRLDVDADGDLTDSDNGRAAIPLELWTDPNGDGDPSDGTLVDTATTDIDGNYEFTGLPAGNYVVLEKDPDTDFRSTNDADGGIDEDSWNSIAVNLGPGQHVPDRDFLDTYDPPGTLAFIVNLRAIESGDRRVVEWTTGAESGTVGFHLHGVSPDGQRPPLNTQLLPSTGEPSGGIYRVEDARAAAERTLQYIIRETEDDSGTRTYGPFTADLVQHDPAEGELWTGARERPVNAAVSATRATGETTGDALSIKVRESGVQRVTAARFGAAVGLSEEDARAAILAGDVSLRHRGRTVAYLPATDGAALLFHAPELRDPYAAYAVYTLQPGAGLLADSADGSAAGTAPNAVFVDIVHAEEDNKAIPHRIAAVEDGLWVWEKVVADTDQSVANFAIETAAPAEGDAILVLNLHGGTNPDHRLDVSINGTAVGHITFDGKVPHTGAVQFDADILNAGTNQVTVAAVLPEGVATSMVYVDSLDLLYPRSYGATDNAATIFADGNPVVTVGGFTASDITVLDVTAPNRIVRLDGVAVSADGDGGYAATFAPTDPDGQYAVFAGEAVIEPASDPVSRTNLASPANAADYLIVTTAALRDAAQALADWRAADGFTVKIVTVGEIAREFAQGRPTPQAIQQFLNTAYRRWSTKPKYAVLLGKGTYDYRNADGGNDNLVPALLTRTEEGMRPSDLLFGDVVGADAVPEIAVGRLPATTPAQAQAMIAKIIAYESAQDAYANEAVIAADKLDLAGDFTADAEAIRNRFFAGKTVRTVYLDHAEPTRGASDLRDALRDGSRLALYIGHGGFDQLARGELLAGKQVDGLDNGASLPIVLAATCHAANFSEPRRTSLSETLVLAENEGAIAVWAPTGLGFNANSAALLQAFCAAAYEDGTARLGDAATRAAERWLATVGPEELRKDAVRTFALIGDPALKLNLSNPRR